MTETAPRLEVRGLTKRFGPLIANDGVSFDVAAGELHCLLGENGAGKSTLSACLFGMLSPDAGDIRLDGRPLAAATPAQAIAAGIGMVHQHFVLVPAFTVTENIIVGTGKGWRADLAGGRRRIAEICDRYGLTLDPDRMVADLSVGEKQWVEVVKALYLGARLLILDEPTAVLTPEESDRLFAVIRRLTGEGISVLLISHKMREVLQSDRVTVLRRGRLVATVRTVDTTSEELSRLMVGRSVLPVAAAAPATGGSAVLQVDNLVLDQARKSASPVSLTLHAGEILGIAGVAGNGQDELLETLAGLRPPLAGTLRLLGQPAAGLGARALARRGVGYVPADRFRDGLVPDFTIGENLVIGRHWQADARRGPFLNTARMRRAAQDAIADFAIAADGPDARCGRLSGGNAQKVILAREFAKARHLLLCNQPTRGVDIGATEFIHRELLRKRAEGCATILASEELDDLLALSDRIAVMFRGSILGIFIRAEADTALIGRLMAGHGERAA